MDLAIIILNWNAVEDTARCIHAISSWKRLRPEIWVVDNASTDCSLQAISRGFPGVHLIRNSTNLGFGGGNNRGILGALSIADVPVLLLNNDAWIEEADAIRLLETLQADERLGFVGPLLFDAKQRDRLLAAGGKNPARHHRTHIERLPSGGPIHIVECVPGTVILIRDKVFLSLIHI